MAGGSEVRFSDITASINFATASNGDNVYLSTEFGEAVTVRGVQLHCTRTVTLANGTNTEMAVQVLLNPQDQTWRALGVGITTTAATNAAFNGWTWNTSANTIAEIGAVCSWATPTTSYGVSFNIYGMRLLVSRDAGDATLAGTITNAYLSTIPA